MNKLMCIALIGALYGCADGKEAPEVVPTSQSDKQFHADVTFTTEERAEIDQYVAFFIANTDAPIEKVFYDLPHPNDTRVGGGWTCRNCIIRDPHNPGGGLCVNKSDMLGWYSVIGVGAGIEGQTISPKLVARLTAHEIGHSFNMDHVKDPMALMFWEMETEEFSWTVDDQREWDRVHR